MKKVLNVVLVVLTVSMVFMACKKDEPVTVTSCFADNYNGSYTGSLVDNNVPSNATITLTKTGCSTATLQSSSFATITISSLNASAGGGYNGTTQNNQSISISVSNNSISIGGAIQFSGTR
jgi:hypothetical protein